MAERPILADLVPIPPEERLRRAAVGEPGRLGIEVGLDQPRFAPPKGRRTPDSELRLRRALGGVAYPADREQLLAQAIPWLKGRSELEEHLRQLPELTYGGELEVLRRLAADAAADQPQEPGSAGAGKEGGSSTNR